MQKENGIITTTIEGSLISYYQTGLAPGEEYIVNIQPRKGSTLGPETSITAKTSKVIQVLADYSTENKMP